MEHIFYITGLVVLLYRLPFLIEPMKQSKLQQKLDENKKLKDDDPAKIDLGFDKKLTGEPKELRAKNSFNEITALWSLLGLLTFNWLGFAFFFVFGIAVMNPLYKILKWSLVGIIVRWLYCLVLTAWTLFVILNKYHLRIDLYHLALTYFR